MAGRKTIRAAALLAALLAAEAAAGPTTRPAMRIENASLGCDVDLSYGIPTDIWSKLGVRARSWLHGPIRLSVRNEVTGKAEGLPHPALRPAVAGVDIRQKLPALGLDLHMRWGGAKQDFLTWQISLSGKGERVGHEVTLELPALEPGLHVFTPSERGIMSVAAYPTYRPQRYGQSGWGGGRVYVLPLVSVFDTPNDVGLTLALAPDQNIPHLQVDWQDAKTLRLRLAHRAMGGGRPSTLHFRFYSHKADYRSVLKAYSDDFPRYFNPPMPRGKYEGAFWYHHIHDHPPFDEMARQRVRYIWSSFWFTHLGEYLPDAGQWQPYTYARWWKLGEKMSDEKIRAFVRKMHDRGIGTYAYFNVTEYGGAGGGTGDASRAREILRKKFADALFKGPNNKPVPTWEGSMAMNPGAAYALRPYLREQVRRHLTRLPEIDGFVIDRLDWASRLDYGHDDGLTRVGARPAENMAVPVGDAVREVCRMAHEAKKRVFVNQFWRIDVLADVDGYCHEYDYARGLGYLSPYRPASAWHHAVGYRGDLLKFEAQLKRRLQFALQPQMIAHKFPISQQAADPKAADLLEIYAPLFECLVGKRQVLRAHCVEVTGPNDANLFVNAAGHQVVPITSRLRFLSRGSRAARPVEITLRDPRPYNPGWVHVYSADGPPYRMARRDFRIKVPRHGTSSVVVVGTGPEPKLRADDADRIAKIRRRTFPAPVAVPARPVTLPEAPTVPDATRAIVRLRGVRVGAGGVVDVLGEHAQGKDGTRRFRKLGRMSGDGSRFELPLVGGRLPAAAPRLVLTRGDEGTWFVPQRAELLAATKQGRTLRVAQWTGGSPAGTVPIHPVDPEASTQSSAIERALVLPLQWCTPVELRRGTARFVGKDPATGGRWVGKFGSRAAWIPRVTGGAESQHGYRLVVDSGQAFTWRDGPTDPRALQTPKGSRTGAKATCWFHDRKVAVSVRPGEGAAERYRLTLYVLDFDRNGRAMGVSVGDEMETLDRRQVSAAETGKGVYLTWTVTGPVRVELTKRKGHNVVLSGVFIDSADR